MARFVIRRLLVSIPVMLLSTIVVFALVSARGDPLAELRRRPLVSAETVRALEEQYHLDESRPKQYLLWLGDFVRGDWGDSFATRRPVTDMISESLKNTMILLSATFVFSVVVAMAVGIVGAIRQYSAFDYAASGFSYFGFSMPIFWFGLILQLTLVIWAGETLGIEWFYVQGMYSTGKQGDLLNLAQHMVLPVLTLSLTLVAGWSRFQRASMLEVVHSDYVRTARAKGVPERTVVLKHALRNALIPFVTVVSIDIGVLVGGAVITERIFSWPGMGTLFISALDHRDYPVILAWLAVVVVGVILANLVADVVYGLLDPRIRLS
jgi:peptide/nickel transport system permease protein